MTNAVSRLRDKLRGKFGRRLSAGPLASHLIGLQEVTIASGAGSARTSLSLDAVSTQAKQASDSLGELLRTAEHLHAHFGQVAESVQNTLNATREMNQITAAGRQLSQETNTTSLHLQTQMNETVQRIERLVKSMGSIMSVSQTIEGIARQTALLSFNAAIEAARAGEHGSGFAVVAAEVRSLAQHTESHTKAIKVILDEIAAELTPAREALLASQALVGQAAQGTQAVGLSLERVAQLANDTAADMTHVDHVVGEQRSGMDTVFANLKRATSSSSAITRETQNIVQHNYAVSQLGERAFGYYADIDMHTPFHRALGAARLAAREAETIFLRAVDSGQCSLDDVLALEYREITGADVHSLNHLFDTRKVPPQGYSPPKYHTRVDHLVDLDIQRLLDGIKQREDGLLFVSVLDLNLYQLTHHKQFCQDWTGDPEKDTAFNRCKRFFYDKWLTTEGARVGVGPLWDKVPNRASRDQFLQAGCDLAEQPGSRDIFNIKLYVRDSSSVMLGVQAPVYVRGQLYGAVSAGWLAKIEQAHPSQLP